MGLESGREHGRQCGEQRATIVPAHPVPKFDVLRPQQRRRIYGLEYVAGGKVRAGGGKTHHDSLQGLGAERDPDQLAGLHGDAGRDAVSKNAGVAYG